ncbi:MAG: hypothetical protein Q4G36_09285 [Paracoccus sp. (in: a-proteobacteria)]|nr:hypothetical protein [Paracoccus sp. (in: a-proteobacteria)]
MQPLRTRNDRGGALAVIVVFDLDGTLIDSAGHIHHSANAVMAERGLPPHCRHSRSGAMSEGVRLP